MAVIRRAAPQPLAPSSSQVAAVFSRAFHAHTRDILVHKSSLPPTVQTSSCDSISASVIFKQATVLEVLLPQTIEI